MPGTGSNYLVNRHSLTVSHGLDELTFEDIRAVGGSMSARIPELIGDFYKWLSTLPEFRRSRPMSECWRA